MEKLRLKESLRSHPEISQPLANTCDPGGRAVVGLWGGLFYFYFLFLLPGMSSYCVFV